MKFAYILLLAACIVALASAEPQKKDAQRKDPQIFAQGGGSRKQGLDLSVDVKKNIWNSANGRHSVDATGGYSQHLGGQYGSSRPNYRAGAGYTYRFK